MFYVIWTQSPWPIDPLLLSSFTNMLLVFLGNMQMLVMQEAVRNDKACIADIGRNY